MTSKTQYGKTVYTKPHWPKPSEEKRPKRIKVPPPLITIWRVTTIRNGRWNLVCHTDDEDHAYAEADKVSDEMRHPESKMIRVEHKAGVYIGEKLYLVNVIPIKLKDIPKPTQLIDHENPSPS